MRVRGGIGVVVALLWCGSAAAAPPTPDPAPVPAPPPPPVTTTTQAAAPPPAVEQQAPKRRHRHEVKSARAGVAAPYHAPPRGEPRQPRHTRISPVQAARYSVQGPSEQGSFGGTAVVLILFGMAACLLVAFAALPAHILAVLPSQLGAARGELIFGGFVVLVAVLVGLSIPLFLQ